MGYRGVVLAAYKKFHALEVGKALQFLANKISEITKPETGVSEIHLSFQVIKRAVKGM